MAVVYVIVAIFAGSEFITENLSNGTNSIIYSLQQAGSFAAGVFVILAGVRLILAEIVPAFKGISEKLVPNAIPALDCPIVFPYAPNAVLIGFLTSFVGGIVSLIIMVFTGTTVIIQCRAPFLLWRNGRCLRQCNGWCARRRHWFLYSWDHYQLHADLVDASHGGSWVPRLNFL